MKRKRLLTMVLACSLIFGQTVWAAGPSSESVEAGSSVESQDVKNIAEEGVADNEAEDPAEAPSSDDIVTGNDMQEGQKTDAPEEKADAPEVKEETPEIKAETKKEQPETASEIEAQKVTIHFQSDDRTMEVDESVYNNLDKVVSSDDSVISWHGAKSERYDYGDEKRHYYLDMYTSGLGEATLDMYDADGNILARYDVTVEYSEVNVYTDAPTVFQPSDTGYQMDDADYENWELINSDPSVCEGTLKFAPLAPNVSLTKTVTVLLNAKKAGTTVFTVNYQGSCMYAFKVNVPENGKPENIVSIKDPMLLCMLLQNTTWIDNQEVPIDADGDNYISEEEMATVKSLLIYEDYGITDLTGLEYAKDLYSIDMSSQSNLVNIDALFKLKSLGTVKLKGTKVSLEDRFKIADFQDVNLCKGEIKAYDNEQYIFDDTPVFETIEGEDCVRCSEQYNVPRILGIAAGDAVVRISSGSYYKDIKVHVDGIDENQPVGDSSDTGIKAAGGLRVLGSNGALWEVYPETKKIKDNVSDYVAGWVYSGKDAMEYKNYTDKDGTLWSDEGKLAENIVKFTGHYALNEQGVLKDIYGTDGKEISDVKKWQEYRVYAGFDEESMATIWDSTTYVLKEDGTLWGRKEVEKDAPSNDFQKIKSDIRDINETGYLTESGEYYSWIDASKPILTGIKDIQNIGLGSYPQFYTDENGTGYIYIYGTGEYVDIGKATITDLITSNGADYYLTSDHEVYSYKDGKKEKLAENAAEIIPGYGDGSEMCYKTLEGEYRRLSDGSKGTEDNPIIISGTSFYNLADKGIKDDYGLLKNTVPILDHVKAVFYTGTNTIYAIRTDGSIWDVGKLPKQLFDMDMVAMKGDLDGDNAVTISDLRLTLRAVCKKTTLTAEQEMAADVEKDGNNTVDIKDLRKMLRFICKKIESLD